MSAVGQLPARTEGPSPAGPPQGSVRQSRGLFDRKILGRAAVDSVKKLDPRVQVRNPVMFVVLIGTVVTLVESVARARHDRRADRRADPQGCGRGSAALGHRAGRSGLSRAGSRRGADRPVRRYAPGRRRRAPAAMVEGANRKKTPNEIALTILLAILTIVFVPVVVTLQLYGHFAGASEGDHPVQERLPALGRDPYDDPVRQQVM